MSKLGKAMSQPLSGFVGRTLKSIFVGVKLKHYNEELIIIVIDNDKYVLKKIETFDGGNFYNFTGGFKLKTKAFFYRLENNSGTFIEPGVVGAGAIFPADDVGYNYVNQLCKCDLFNPCTGQKSYSVRYGPQREFAVSIFVDDSVN